MLAKEADEIFGCFYRTFSGSLGFRVRGSGCVLGGSGLLKFLGFKSHYGFALGL